MEVCVEPNAARRPQVIRYLQRVEVFKDFKKKELEAEFAATFQEVEFKKTSLAQLEMNIQEMEATRKRKEREFQRLQRNLMELLEEQKNELDELREKGIQLESATASSAAAAAKTAAAAKANEEKAKLAIPTAFVPPSAQKSSQLRWKGVMMPAWVSLVNLVRIW